MKGLELSKKYYEDCFEKILNNDFSEIKKHCAIGLFGSGSECFGFDDDISKDHDFEPGFVILIPGEDLVDRRQAFLLQRAYDKLPNEFEGYKKGLLNPVGGSRKGVIRIDNFLNEKLGGSVPMDASRWLTLPSYSLAEFVNGEIWLDEEGLFTSYREYIKEMPEDVRLKRLAGNLLLMAQSGQYNYERCINHGEKAAAQLALNIFVNAALESVFLLNKAYMPYYKWSFRALKNLSKLSYLYEPLEFLLLGEHSQDVNGRLFTLGEICNAIQDELRSQKITAMNCDDMEKHAYSVNDHINNADIRNLNILFCV